MYIVMLILNFTANQPLVDRVSSCVKDTVVLILDLIFLPSALLICGTHYRRIL